MNFGLILLVLQLYFLIPTFSFSWLFPIQPPNPPALPQEPECGPNEIFLKRGKASNCDAVCSELCKPCTRVYIIAPEGCYCTPGYARNDCGECIHISECCLCK